MNEAQAESRRSGMSLPLASTAPSGKHAVPTVPGGVVVRHALLARLEAAPRPSVVSVIAPAGYGKTTLLRQWAERAERVAYVRVDERENDPAVLLSDLLVALDSLEPIDSAPLQRLRMSPTTPGLTAFQRLGEAIWESRVEGVLMLDEIEHISSHASVDALSWLAERMPAALQLVVSGRSAATLPLARLAARDQLLTIGATDLALDLEQVRAVGSSLGLELTEDEASEIIRITEGWPIAIYLSLRSGREAGTAVVPRPQGPAPLIAGFLRSEILDPLEPDAQDWMLRSSVLDTMSGSLCDAALETSGSAARLRAMEASNLLVAGIDDGTSYRYHPLLREFLRDQLDLRQPGEAGAIMRRAAAWCESNGAVDQAAEYAHATGDLDAVAPLVARAVWPLTWAGRVATIDRWVRWFDRDDMRVRYPSIAVLAGFMYAMGGNRHEAELWLRAAERSKQVGAMPDGTPSKEPWVAMLRGMMVFRGVVAMAQDAATARAGMAPDSPFMPGVHMLGVAARCLAGDFEGAALAAEEAAQVAEMRRASPGLLVVLGLRASVALRSGDIRGARGFVDHGLEWIASVGFEEDVSSGLIYATGARTALVAGSSGDARVMIGRVNRLRPGLTAAIPWLSVLVRLETMRACLALADAASARALLLEVDDILHVRPDLGTLVADTDAIRATLSAIDDAGAAHWTLTAAELRVLSFLPTHLTFPEIAQRLSVSPHTVKTQSIAIYGKLGATSRREAIERGVEHGLLDASVLRYPSGTTGSPGIG